MKHRKLRIAWSVACGILCLLLILWCVRSYWRITDVGSNFEELAYLGCITYQGELQVLWTTDLSLFQGTPFWSDKSAEDWNVLMYGALEAPPAAAPKLLPGFDYSTSDDAVPGVAVPLWFLVLVTGAAAVLPWVPRTRFSLRTLLIGTTIVAVLLGLAMWMSNR